MLEGLSQRWRFRVTAESVLRRQAPLSLSTCFTPTILHPRPLVDVPMLLLLFIHDEFRILARKLDEDRRLCKTWKFIDTSYPRST